MEKQLLKDMFDNLLHIGNKINFWNPRMKPYIYGSTNGVHVINLMKTVQKMDEVKKVLEEAIKGGKKVLIVATKLQGRDSWRKLAEDTGCSYVSEKWVPGLLTNFKTIRKRIGNYLKLLKDAEIGAFNIYTKKEKASKMLELEKLNIAYSGLKEMKKIPDILFVVDSVYERQAVREANILGVEVIAIANTNADDLVVANLIPANTNSVKSLDFLAKELKAVFATKRPVEGPNSMAMKPSTDEKGPKVVKMDEPKASGEKKLTPKVKKDDVVEAKAPEAKEEKKAPVKKAKKAE